VDGEVRGARWFGHHRVFAMARDTLLRTAAVEAVTAEAAAARRGDRVVPAAPSSEAIASFIAEVEAAAESEVRATDGLNDNVYMRSDRAWGSKTVLRPDADVGGRRTSRETLSVDYLLK